MWMKMLPVCLCLCAQIAIAENQVNGNDPGVPELAVLNRFVGTWEGKMPNSSESINAKREWTLNGRFLKHDFSISSGELSGVIYRGYDSENSRYTLTMFDSTGNVSLLVGYWSDEQKTLTFNAIDSSCPVQRYESYFPDDKTEQWKIVMKSNSTEVNGLAKKLN